MIKKCSKCQIEKSINEFYKNCLSKDGYRPSCKSCRKNPDLDYYNEKRREKEKSPERKFIKYKYSAKHRGYTFELNFDEFKKIVSQNCIYCDSDVVGVDRVNSSIGYVVR
jgi:hypothetical protein